MDSDRRCLLLGHATVVFQASDLVPLAEADALGCLASNAMLTCGFEHDRTDSLTNFPLAESLGLGTHCNDSTDRLVRGNDWCLGLIYTFPDLIAGPHQPLTRCSRTSQFLYPDICLLCMAKACGAHLEQKIIAFRLRNSNVEHLKGLLVLWAPSARWLRHICYVDTYLQKLDSLHCRGYCGCHLETSVQYSVNKRAAHVRTLRVGANGFGAETNRALELISSSSEASHLGWRCMTQTRLLDCCSCFHGVACQRYQDKWYRCCECPV